MADVGSLIEKLTSTLAENVLEEVSLLANFGDDFDILCSELNAIKSLLKDVGDKRNSRSMCSWLERFEDFLDDAADIVEECAETRKFCDLIFRHRMSLKIKKLKERLIKIHDSAKYLQYLTSVLDVNARVGYGSEDKREREKASASQKELQPVGMEKDIEDITDLIRKEDGLQVISVLGMGGIGKTLLVKQVFDKVQKHFHHQVWIEVSKKMDVTHVLNQMRNQILDTDTSHNIDDNFSRESTRDSIKKYIKELEGTLTGKLSLFVFDDVWERDALDQFDFLLKSKSKFLITTRDTIVAESMSHQYIHPMKTLSHENSWKLFCIYAFPDLPHNEPPVLLNKFKDSILNKCCGLPLAIKTIGLSMAKLKMLPNEWQRNLDRLNALDATTDRVRGSLMLSYEALPDCLKPCFLYCSLFPKKTEIKCEYLVYAWIALQFISTQVAAAEDASEVGRSYLKELIDRSLIEVSKVGGDGRVESCKMYDLLHDLAVSESLKQTKCLLKPGENLEKLPVEQCAGSRRISFIKNNISAIEEAIQSPRLRILLLSDNGCLESISASAFSNLTYLTVLDLSGTAIKSLPKSTGSLKHLKFLNLSRTEISILPRYFNGLRRLQFLDVSYCSYLSKLHSGIRKHKFMLHLNMEGCVELKSLPKGISKLNHLHTLKCSLSDPNSNRLQLSNLKGLIHLQHLALEIDAPWLQQTPDGSIKLEQGTFGGMKKMRILSFKGISSRIHLPKDMEVMERLEIVHLSKCSVPDWISELHSLMELVLDQVGKECNYKGLESLPNLTKLHLSLNNDCRELPKEFGGNMAFPKLEELIIEKFYSLEKLPLLEDKAMPMLRFLRLHWCKKLKNMGEELCKLQSLEEVYTLRLQEINDPWNEHWKKILQDRKIKIKDDVHHERHYVFVE